MIKFKAYNAKGEDICGIGLSRANCEKLLEGHPIGLRPDSMELPWPGEIILIAGETEEAIATAFKRAGLLGPETEIRVDPKLREQLGDILSESLGKAAEE